MLASVFNSAKKALSPWTWGQSANIPTAPGSLPETNPPAQNSNTAPVTPPPAPNNNTAPVTPPPAPNNNTAPVTPPPAPKPTETKPTETKPTETKPTETKPTETKPEEPKPNTTDNTPGTGEPTDNSAVPAEESFFSGLSDWAPSITAVVLGVAAPIALHYGFVPAVIASKIAAVSASIVSFTSLSTAIAAWVPMVVIGLAGLAAGYCLAQSAKLLATWFNTDSENQYQKDLRANGMNPLGGWLVVGAGLGLVVAGLGLFFMPAIAAPATALLAMLFPAVSATAGLVAMGVLITASMSFATASMASLVYSHRGSYVAEGKKAANEQDSYYVAGQEAAQSYGDYVPSLVTCLPALFSTEKTQAYQDGFKAGTEKALKNQAKA